MGIRLVVVGAAGRMGKRIVCLAAECGEFQVVGAVERRGHGDIGKDAGLVAGCGELGVELAADYPVAADVAVDFSLAEAVDATIGYCVEKGVALVSGTTGLTERQRRKIDEAAKKIPVIYGTNMSVGMNVLFGIVGEVAAMLGEDYDIEVIEQHHRFKKDAPSGSALTLAENICKAGLASQEG